MLKIQRQNDIMRLLREHRELTVKEICALLYYSPATVRRDLADLERQGLLKRSFGGAVLVDRYADQLPLALRAATHIPEKKRICAKAAAAICDGETVFIDASSTTFFMAPYLKGRDITVITNNPMLCVILSEMKVKNFCTGGEMLTESVALVGTDAERFIQGIKAHKCFFSSRGFCNGEGSDSSKPERDIKIAMIQRSETAYFLYDSSKIGACYPYCIPLDSSVKRITENETDLV